MKTFAKIFCLLVILFSGNAIAKSFDDFGKQLSYFYLSPSREAFNTFQHDAEQFKGKLKAANNGVDVMVAVMIARISEKYGWAIVDGELGSIAKEILESTTPLAKFVSDDAKVNPSKLDIWWASFIATGEDQYLEKVFQYAGQELPKGNIEKALVIGAASWSFKSNCGQHKRVLEFAKKKLASKELSEKQKQFLQDCIGKLEVGSNDVWISRDGKPVPNTDAMKSIKGFGGWLIVTPDTDWEAKWNTSPDSTPTFHGVSAVEYGVPLTILTFFTNPKPDSDSNIQVYCDIKLIRPDGSVPVDTKGIDCASGKLQGSPRNLRLTAAVIKFIGEDGDPSGTWRVEINLTDKNRDVSVPLKAEFTLNPKRVSPAVKAASKN